MKNSPTLDVDEKQQKKLIRSYEKNHDGMKTLMETMLFMKNTSLNEKGDIAGDSIPEPSICAGDYRMNVLVHELYDVSFNDKDAPVRIGTKSDSIIEGGDATCIEMYWAKTNTTENAPIGIFIQHVESKLFMSVHPGALFIYGEDDAVAHGCCMCYFGYPGLVSCFSYNMTRSVRNYLSGILSLMMKQDALFTQSMIWKSVEYALIRCFQSNEGWREKHGKDVVRMTEHMMSICLPGVVILACAEEETCDVNSWRSDMPNMTISTSAVRSLALTYAKAWEDVRKEETESLEKNRQDMIKILNQERALRAEGLKFPDVRVDYDAVCSALEKQGKEAEKEYIKQKCELEERRAADKALVKKIQMWGHAHVSEEESVSKKQKI